MAKAKTDVAEIADSRINVNLNFDEIHDEESYFKAVRNYLKIRKSGDPVEKRGDNLIDYLEANPSERRKMFKESEAYKLVNERLAKKQKEFERVRLLRRAQQFEGRRPVRSRVPDERRTAKRIQPVSRVGLRRWERRPNKSDFINVDTRRIKRIATRNLITRGDLRLRNIKITFSDKTGQKFYRNFNGKFRNNPYKRFRR